MPTWIESLRQRGASCDQDEITTFGDRRAELLAARDAAVLCDLSPAAVLRVAGPDAESFLQGQITNDVAALAVGTSQYAAHCSPKGRMLANFLVRRVDAQIFELLLPGAIAEATRKRLTMYLLRSKATIEDASAASVRIGIGGPLASAAVSTLGTAPAVHRSMAIEVGNLAALPGSRFIAFVAPRQAPALWDRLTAKARPAGCSAWQWLTIRAGVPVITAATQDQFVPQMVNLDALGGISFNKGCYTGQEIVARTQYLGRLKERLYLGHVDAAAAVIPGTRLHSTAFDAQPCGTVLAAAPAPEGGSDLLAVLQITAADGGDVRLGATDGAPVAIERLPYALPAASAPRGRIA